MHPQRASLTRQQQSPSSLRQLALEALALALALPHGRVGVPLQRPHQVQLLGLCRGHREETVLVGCDVLRSFGLSSTRVTHRSTLHTLCTIR